MQNGLHECGNLQISFFNIFEQFPYVQQHFILSCPCVLVVTLLILCRSIVDCAGLTFYEFCTVNVYFLTLYPTIFNWTARVKIVAKLTSFFLSASSLQISR